MLSRSTYLLLLRVACSKAFLSTFSSPTCESNKGNRSTKETKRFFFKKEIIKEKKKKIKKERWYGELWW